MPYSGPGDDSLPGYVKKLSAKDKRQWVAVFNSAYKSCQAEGGRDCEASAFAQANGVVKGGKRMDIKEIWERVRGLFEPLLNQETANTQEILPTQTRALMVTRVADGRFRWLMIAASAVINRVGAIDSMQLFDNFIKRATESGEYPVLDFYHEGPQLRLGQSDWLRRDGALYLASGTFDDTEIGRAAAQGIESHPGEWGASIAYHPTVEPLELVAEGMIPVYTDGINNFISIVSKRMAANLFTATLAAEEVSRMDQKVFDELVKLVGEEAAKPFAAMVDEANRTIAETGMVTRAEESVPTTQIDPPAEPAPEQGAPAEERQDMGAIEEKIAALAERISKLEQSLSGQSAKEEAKEKRSVDALAAIESRLGAVEVNSRAWADWLAGLPDGRQSETTYRARDQEPAPLTMAQLAEQNLSKLNRGPRQTRH